MLIREQKLNRMSVVLAALMTVFVVLPFTVSAMMQPTIINVPADANLQLVADSAPVGATLRLPDGAVYGPIVIGKSLSIESTGTRVVSGAPGIQFQVGAKIITPNADPAVYVKPGTINVRIKGVEIAPAGFVYDVVRIGASGNEQGTLQNTPDKVPSGISLENVWIHGLSDQDSQRGVAANAANVWIVNSRISEIHFRGQDAQAICAWNGPGPFHIIGNYLEASGENVMFGGAQSAITNLIASDIEIRNNYFFKPLSWKIGDPSYAGIHWAIKNLLEFKNARNIVVDGNVLENSWGDAQIGYGILFTVRTEDGKMPWATVENISFSNNIVKNCDQGFQFLGTDAPNPSGRGNNAVFFNNQFVDIANRFLTITAFNNVVFRHNTHLQKGNIAVLYGEPSLGFVYENNVTFRAPDTYGFFGDGIGEGNAALAKFTPDGKFQGNVIAGASAAAYPPNNFYPADLSNLNSYKGTDGLTPGYSASVAIPTPTPTATPSPTPTPTATPTPTPVATPTPTPTPTPPVCTMSVSSPVIPQWSSGKLVVNLSGFNSPATISATGSTGQVAVDWPQSRSISGSSVIIEFGLAAKKKSSSVIVNGPCGSKTVNVTVQ